MLAMTTFLIETKWVGLNVILKAFTTPFEKLIVIILQIILKRVVKLAIVLQKPNQFLSLSSNLSYLASTKAYGLKIRRKNMYRFDKN